MNRLNSYEKSYSVIWLLFLSGCFGGPGFLKQNEAYQAQDAAIKVVTAGEVTSGAISAASMVTQTLTAPSTSSISGVKVSVPPGALAIDTTIHLEESATLATGMMSQNLGITLSATAGRAVSITADNVGTSELARPMTLSIPLNASLWMTNEERSLLIVYRTHKNGEVFNGVIPPDKIKIVGNEVRFEIVRWGAYQPAYIPKSEESKVASVVEQKTEEKIITKTEQQKFPVATMSALNISYDSTLYLAKLSATLENGEAEKCYVEAYGIETIERHFEWTDVPLFFELDFKGDPERIYVKIKMGCYLKGSGLLVETTYSTLDVPADESRQDSGNVNPCPTGICPPDIVSISLSSTSLDFTGIADAPGGMFIDVTLEITAGLTMHTDTQFENDCWAFFNPTGPTPIHACEPIVNLGSNKYKRQAWVHKWTKAENQYFLWHMYWKDTTGQTHVLSAGEMRANEPAPSKYQNTDLNLIGFSVTGTAIDLTPPTMNALYFYSEAPTRITMTPYDTPAAPEVASGVGEQVCYGVTHNDTQKEFHNCVHSTISSSWEAAIDMNKLIESGEYTVKEISISDRAQNRRIYRQIQPSDSKYSDISGGPATTTTIGVFTFTK